MGITSETFKIIQCLEVASFSAKELAETLNSDIRKIKYTLSNIGKILGNNKLTTDELHTKISRDPEMIKKIIKNFQIFSPDERKLFIILSFLEDDFVNQNKIAEILNISRKTVTEDISEIKKDLKNYNLSIKSLSSIGLELIGSESDKRFFFYKNFFKLWLETNTIPKILIDYRNYFDTIIKEYEFYETSEKILSSNDLTPTTFHLLDLEITFLISFLRRKFSAEISLESSKFYIQNIEKFLAQYEFISVYEKNHILDFCMRLNEVYFENTLKAELKKTSEFLDFLSENSKYKFDLSKINLISISGRMEIIRFKKEMRINQLYVFNKNSSNDYQKLFYSFRKLFREYFENGLDSFDEVFLFQNLLKHIHEKEKKQDKKEGEILVVSNFFSFFMVKEICKDWESFFPRGTIQYISARALDKHLLNSNIRKIVIFEDIEIPEGNYDIQKFSFPVTALELENLKNF